MLFFRAYTLVDITATGVTKLIGDNELERNQQRNWETVLQVLGLRTQPTIIEPPTCIEANDKVVKQYFGELYTGRQRMWQFSFVGEHSGAYSIGQHPVAGLLQDFEQVPILTGLTETARFLLPIFYPSGAIKNIAIIPLDENKFSL